MTFTKMLYPVSPNWEKNVTIQIKIFIIILTFK